MRLRFRQTVPSLSPEYPFMAGQIIDIPDDAVTPAIRGWLALGWVDLWPVDESATVSPSVRTATLARPHARGRR